MLTAWLLITCKNPFNLTKFDNLTVKCEANKNSITERIIDCLTLLNNLYILHGEMVYLFYFNLI